MFTKINECPSYEETMEIPVTGLELSTADRNQGVSRQTTIDALTL
jgi:hypothetical protein